MRKHRDIKINLVQILTEKEIAWVRVKALVDYHDLEGRASAKEFGFSWNKDLKSWTVLMKPDQYYSLKLSSSDKKKFSIQVLGYIATDKTFIPEESEFNRIKSEQEKILLDIKKALKYKNIYLDTLEEFGDNLEYNAELIKKFELIYDNATSSNVPPAR